MVTLATAGFVIGRGDTSLRLLIQSGEAWLSTTQRGSVSLVNGLSGRAVVELRIKGAQGHRLLVTQVGGGEVLVEDTVTGKLVRVNTAQFTLGPSIGGLAGSTVVAGLTATYVVSYQSDTVQRIDPVTLAPIGPPVRLPGPPGRSAVVDKDGTLWVALPATGSVIPVGAHGSGRPVRVGADGARLVLTTAGGVPLVVDVAAGRIIILGQSGSGSVLALPASAARTGGRPTLLVPGSGVAGSLPIVDPNGSPSLLLVNLSRGVTSVVPLGPGVHGDRFGAPLEAGPRVFVPDYSTGSVLVYVRGASSSVSAIPVLGHSGSFESEVVDGIAYFNNPAGNGAVVVTPDGRAHQVTKTGRQVPTGRPRPTVGPAPPPASGGPQPPPTSPPPTSPPSSGGGGSHSPSPRPTPQPSRSRSPAPTPKPTPTRTPTPKPTPTPTPTPTPPLAPQNPQATAGPGYVDVRWQPPSGGGPVSSYTVGINPAAPGASQAATGATSVRITGLACGVMYGFTVYSIGAAGQQVPAQPVSAQVACSPPGAPTGLTASESSHQVALNWSAPSGGGTITYNVSWNGGGQTGVTSTSDTITGLTNFQAYTFTVTAVSSAGTGGSASLPVNLSPGQTWAYNITNNWIYPLNIRSGPSTGDPSNGQFPPTPRPGPGPGVSVICQVVGGGYTDPTGSPSGDIWDEISYGGGGGWVADGYVTTPNSAANTFSPPIWPCQ